MTSPVTIWRQQSQISKFIGLTGTLVSFTIIRVAPLGYADQVPYAVALVEFPDSSKQTFQVVDVNLEDLHTGLLVVCVIRRSFQPRGDEVISYGLKVKPV